MLSFPKQDTASLLKFITLALLLILIALPSIQMRFSILPEAKTEGVQKKVSAPKISSSAIISGEYQKSFVEWFNKNIGWRGPIVFTDNQLNFSLFRDLSNHIGTRVVLGKKNFLYEQAYINSFNRHHVPPKTELEHLVKSLAELQSLLKKKGFAFLLVITPSKAEIYPENIPEKYIHPDRKNRRSEYQEVLQLLNEYEINLVNGVKILAELKQQGEYDVFTAGGIHWNFWSACKVSEEIVEDLAGQLDKQISPPPCSPLEIRKEPLNTDRDMLALLNLWDESPFQHPIPYPPRKKTWDPSTYHPSVLFVGDSFTWTPLFFFDKHATFRKRKFLYYFSSEYNFWIQERKDGKGIRRRESQHHHKAKVQLDWEKAFTDREAVVIFVNQSVMHSAGNGFLEQALVKLQNLPN